MTSVTPPHLLADLLAFLRFPSVSGDASRDGAVKRCAAWLAEYLRRIGFPLIQIVRTSGHPIVFAEWNRSDGRPTILLYGHYDVQPPGALSEWANPPFEPVVRDGVVYARGAADDKGPIMTLLAAVAQSFKRGEPPVNVKVLIEGEEEIGSPHLPPLIRHYRDRLAADVALISDTRMASPTRPAIIYGQRGSLHLELEIIGSRELHSGAFGGAVPNPAGALAEILASLHDKNGRVTLPNFYTDVRPVSAEERVALTRDGPADAVLLRNAGTPHGWGEPDFTAFERTTIRPAIIIAGISAGSGGGSVVPGRATAKINIRIVPDQNPNRIAESVERFVTSRLPRGMRAKLRVRSAAKPLLFRRDHPVLRSAALALRHAFGVAPAFLRSGGTIPIARLLFEELRAPVVLTGFARPDDRMHGSNEKFHLRNLIFGAAAVRRFFGLMARTSMEWEPE